MHRKRKGQPLGCPFLFGYSSCPSPAISPSPRTTEQRSRRARQTLGNLAGFVDAAGFRWRQRLPASRVWRCAREARLVDWHAPLVPAPIRAPREGAAECSRVRPTTPSAQRATPRRPSPGCGASLPVSSHARPSATGRLRTTALAYPRPLDRTEQRRDLSLDEGQRVEGLSLYRGSRGGQPLGLEAALSRNHRQLRRRLLRKIPPLPPDANGKGTNPGSSQSRPPRRRRNIS